MYVGVNLDATTRQQGVRPKPIYAPPLDLPSAASTTDSQGKKSTRRSQSFSAPSNRLTQPTKSSRSRSSAVASVVTGTPTTRTSLGSPDTSRQSPDSAHSPSSRNSPFATPGSSTSRSRPPTYTARLVAHEKTHSPSGRYHPDSVRRREIRSVDMHTDIDFFAAGGAPDNDRKMKEASWLCSQAFIESLRVYPDPFKLRPVTLPGESIAFSGNTQSARRPHTEHLETAMRRRLSIAPVDSEWLPEQLPQEWPTQIREGEWRSVGPLKPSTDPTDPTMGRLFRSRSAGALTPGRGGSARATGGTPRSGRSTSRAGTGAPTGDATSPAAGGMAFFNR